MTQFEPLLEVTQILKEKALEKHRRNLDESARLAQEIEQIDELRRSVQADSETIGARQMLGADALWQGWLLRKRAEFLRQAALARAREFDSLAQARTAFSRAEAAKELDEKAREERRQKLLAREADTLEALGTMRRFQNR
ncbi:hypothetical protein [Tropicibacter naphthalenivorans]|uniref:Flagellar FliJ protein n=1 Tax=Tropicibacter naphthalenivorans TaxID=441103 RepID=A0A0N7M078_9RHOB|nr:hypothetical protein [Tropicibacter naphthalenivorans]CUH79705.1 hypothetical protein TRN7648_02606 [Tropicibacter naphthalenivorans]SMC74586.1 hypothetical protein SAMN04488093_103235 [Tropicibacter naphthalenivorans]